MNITNTKALRKDFPQLFHRRFQFECGDGWEGLVRGLCEKLAKSREPQLDDDGSHTLECMCEGCGGDEVVIRKAKQVKEKFGELRFYVDLPQMDDEAGDDYQDRTDHIFAMIEAATTESMTVCELCGKAGKTMNLSGLYKTLCRKCGAKVRKERV